MENFWSKPEINKNNKRSIKCEFLINCLYIIIFLIILILTKENEEQNFNIITLKINKKGNISIFYSGEKSNSECNYNDYERIVPDMVKINGINQTKISAKYYFNTTENIVELMWKNNLENIGCLFYYCTDIIELDLSKFNTTQVISMNYMFYECNSLKFLNLSNFNTSRVS